MEKFVRRIEDPYTPNEDEENELYSDSDEEGDASYFQRIMNRDD